MRKRGLSHLEAILSFVLFIGFLIFAFFFFNPFESNRLLDSSLEYAANEIYDVSEVQLESYSVVIGNDVSDRFVGFEIDRVDPPEFDVNVSVKDEQGNLLDAEYENGIVYVDRDHEGVSANFLTVVFAEGFLEEEVSGAVILEKANYSISSSDISKIVSELRLVDLNYSYHGDYIGLKKDFNLPNRIDFGFILMVEGDIRVDAERSIPDNLEVVSRTDRIELLDRDGGVVFADLVIKTW